VQEQTGIIQMPSLCGEHSPMRFLRIGSSEATACSPVVRRAGASADEASPLGRSQSPLVVLRRHGMSRESSFSRNSNSRDPSPAPAPRASGDLYLALQLAEFA
jgi:hypothetical protein